MPATRSSPWRSRGRTAWCRRLEANPATLEAYPFPCALTVAYTLTENGYETAFTVENTGDKPMPYAIGGHPGFNIPVDEQAAFEDYVIRFEKEETQRCPGIVGDKLLDYSQITLELEGEREIPLRHRTLCPGRLDFREPQLPHRGLGEPRHQARAWRWSSPSSPCWGSPGSRPEQRPLRLPGALDRLRHLGHRGGRLRAEEGHAHLGPQRQGELRLYHPLPVRGAPWRIGRSCSAKPTKQGGPRLQRDRRAHGVLPALRRGGGGLPGLVPAKSPTWASELADVAIYLLGLAEILDVDLGQEVRRKMDINRRRRYGVVDGVWQRLEDGSPGEDA